MPNVTFDAKDIARMFKPEEFEKLLGEIGMELEGRKGDDVVVSVTPNRPDLLSFIGLMRALMLHAGRAKPRSYGVTGKPAFTVKVTPTVMKVRPYIAGLVATDLKLYGNTLRYLIDFTEKLGDNYGRKRRKLAMGLHDLRAIKGNLTYDAKHEGSLVPLRDGSAVSFEDVLKGHKKGSEYGYTITGGNRNYPFLKDSEKVLSLIPIINSDATRVTEKTTGMFIDITGTDRNAVNDVARMMACMLLDIGAKVAPVSIAYPNSREITPSMKARQIAVKPADFNDTIGTSLTAEELVKLAPLGGYSANVARGALAVGVPQYRTDVLNDQDVIEDLAMAYGYSSIKPVPVGGHSVGAENRSNADMDSLAMLLIGLGFSEAMNYYLTNERLQFDSMRRQRSKASITVAKSKTEAISMLRQSILPGLLQNLSDSAHERMPQRLFEIGSVFRLENGKPVEETHLAFVSEHSKANFADAKSAVDAIARHFGNKGAYRAYRDGAFIDGRCAAFMGGAFGEISPEVLETLKIEEPVVAGEIVLKRE